MTRTRGDLLAWGVITSVLYRGALAATPLLVVPVTVHYLGLEAYGAWATAASITTFLIFADFGIGTGLMTKLGQLNVDDQSATARKLVSSAYALLGTISIALAVIFLCSYWFVPWADVLAGGTKGDPSLVNAVTVACLISFALNMLLTLIVRVQYGLQLSAIANLWGFAGAIVNVGAVYLAASLHLTKFGYICVLVFSPLAVAALNAVVFFGFFNTGKLIRPIRADMSREATGQIIRLGLRFLVISTLMTFAISPDIWIVARLTSLDTVPAFAISLRIFSLVAAVVTTLTVPLWPANAQALARGQIEWVRKLTRRMMGISFMVALIPAAVIVLCGPAFVNWWLQGTIQLSQVLLISMALWIIPQAVLSPLFMVQNGAEYTRPQIIAYTLFLVSLPTKYLVGRYISIDFIPLAGAILYVLILGPTALWGYHQVLRTRSPVATGGTSGASARDEGKVGDPV